jgi:erythromycin esterase-like protein
MSSKTETDGHAAVPAAAAVAADSSTSATTAKPPAATDSATADPASAAVQSQPAAVATFGAVTVAVLVELAQREGQSMLIADLIRQRLVGPAEARALARAYARLIDTWNASTTASQQRLRDQRMYQSSFGSSAGGGGGFGSPSFSFAPPARR